MGHNSSIFNSCYDGAGRPLALPFMGLDRRRLRSLVCGLEDPAATAQSETSGGVGTPAPVLTVDQVLSLWRQRVETARGELDWRDLQTMRDAVLLYKYAWQLGPEQGVCLEDFSAFVTEEAQATPASGQPARQLLRSAVARDLGPLHKYLREFQGGVPPFLGGTDGGSPIVTVSTEELTKCLAAIFALYGCTALCPQETADELLLADGCMLVDGSVDFWQALFQLLGRRRAPVELVLYDLSQGALRLFSPLLFGRQFEAIYHSSVLVYGIEYWYGGHLFENAPPIDRRVFGAPLTSSVEQLGESAYKPELRVVRLGYTLASVRELRRFLHRDMKPKYRPSNYDVLAHNCNNFSDDVVQFLTGEHIPDTVRKLPELLMDTPTARLLRPFLNRWLRGFHSSSGQQGAQREICDESDAELRIWDEGIIEGGEIDMGYFDPTIRDRLHRKDARREAIRKETSGQLCRVKNNPGVAQVVVRTEESKKQRREVRRAAVKMLGDGQLVDAKAL